MPESDYKYTFTFDFDVDAFTRSIAIDWCEAKSYIYQKYVGDYAIALGDDFEFMCLYPDLFVRWVQAFYKTGKPATEAAIETIKLLKQDENRGH